MSRYINADALHNSFRAWFESYDWDENEIEKHTIATAIRTVDSQPTADAVEVVRCKDCKYRNTVFDFGRGDCMNPKGLKFIIRESDFCSYGERRDDDKGRSDKNACAD